MCTNVRCVHFLSWQHSHLFGFLKAATSGVQFGLAVAPMNLSRLFLWVAVNDKQIIFIETVASEHYSATFLHNHSCLFFSFYLFPSMVLCSQIA